MKLKNLKIAALIGLAMGIASVAMAAESDKVPCPEVVTSVESMIKADPSGVLSVVSAKVSETPHCACDIVKTAITVSKASDELAGQIVETAIRAAPGQYKVIVECAVAVKPSATARYRAAILNVFGGKSGKGGKVVIEPPEETKMHPAVAIAFILDGIMPQEALDYINGVSVLPGISNAMYFPLRPTASTPGGNTPGVFAVETPIPGVPTPEEEREPEPRPRPRPPGGGSGGGGGSSGGSTPANPVIMVPIQANNPG